MIVTRLKTILPEIIHKDQTGFMSGHYTRENLLELLSVIEYANRNKIDALIISYNFEKALNR